tara:strand:- start:410 stop:1195 length:786 start_codon:yes stop_codon:yes gene_type:complete
MIFAKKSLGQNFLIDKNIILKILNLVSIHNKNIIEIGPGQGALTEEILKRNPKSLCLVEKDTNLVKKLKEKYSSNKLVMIYEEDIIKFNLEKIIKKNSIILGNLPYNISSQILVKILKFHKWPPKFNDIIFMFQKELGDKIAGKFQSINYSRLSILTNLRLKIVNKFLVSPNCFFPRPKVKSIIIHFRPKNQRNIQIKRIENLEKVTNILFSNKRKMINKNIKRILNQSQVDNISNLNLNSRPSDISPEIYYKITEFFEKR